MVYDVAMSKRLLSPRDCLVLALLPLAGCATVTAQAQREYVAHFNEPFLTLTSKGATMELKSPEELEGRSFRVSREQVSGGASFSGQLDPDAPESRFRLTVREGACEDDMSGLPFSHTAVLERGAKLELQPHRGCARLITEPQPRER